MYWSLASSRLTSAKSSGLIDYYRSLTNDNVERTANRMRCQDIKQLITLHPLQIIFVTNFFGAFRSTSKDAVSRNPPQAGGI